MGDCLVPVVFLQGMDNKFVFQGVHMMFQGLPQDPWQPNEPRCAGVGVNVGVLVGVCV